MMTFHSILTLFYQLMCKVKLQFNATLLADPVLHKFEFELFCIARH